MRCLLSQVLEDKFLLPIAAFFLRLIQNDHRTNRMLFVRNFRMAEKEITIDNIRIPAGVVVDVPTWGMAHDEEFWEDPFEFKPER